MCFRILNDTIHKDVIAYADRQIIDAFNVRDSVHVSTNHRSLFPTFSKRYCINRWEVREFFTNIFGDCMENIFVKDVLAIG